jgi:hypothetical protein
MTKESIKPQLGFVLVDWVEEEKREGYETTESGILVSEHTANAMKKEITHLEWTIHAINEESVLKVGAKAITSKIPTIIKIDVQGKLLGVMPESEVVACY